jgi:hypothetical protein
MPKLDRQDVDHIDPVKYNESKGKCSLYLKDDEPLKTTNNG